MISRPLIFLGIATLGAAAYLNLGDSPSPSKGKTPPQKKIARRKDAGWDFPDADPNLKFEKPIHSTRNIFKPLVVVDRRVAERPTEKDDIVQIPANLADGEGGWAYTGMAEVDGKRLALLENGGTKQMGYVGEGEPWKKARVVGISTACIVLADEKGLTETVFRFNPNDPPKPKPLPDPGFRPVSPTGRIGENFAIRPMTPPPANFPITR